MLRNTTQAVAAVAGTGVGLFTGNWFTLGTGTRGPAGGLTFRANIGTSSGSNTDSLSLIYEFSDDQSVIKETVTQLVTGTDAGSGTSSGALVVGIGDILTRTSPKRNYSRVRLLASGTNAAFGTVTVGVDAGDFNVLR
jgi:hypothetical protein